MESNSLVANALNALNSAASFMDDGRAIREARRNSDAGADLGDAVSMKAAHASQESSALPLRPPPTPTASKSPRKPFVTQTPLRHRSIMTPARKMPPITPGRTGARIHANTTTPIASASGTLGGAAAVAAPLPPVKRLVIHKLVLQDFKSYAGRQEIGPFHKSFSSIVGPNGSGKSNVIDALLFVFGWRANKMRQGRLSELIHNREGLPPPPYCAVEVWFRDIIDYPDTEKYDVVRGSGLILRRVAMRNNTSQYTLNGTKSSFTEITALLRDRGIDLDHKRFLILQGEVESIAQMPPKGKTEHEEGLLEYLEDLIGTSEYKEPIEEHAKAVDAASDARSEKMNRLKIVQRELDALEPRRKEAESFLRDQNELVCLQSRLWQSHMVDCRDHISRASESLAAVRHQIESEHAKHAEAQQASDSLRASHQAEVNACAEMETHVRDLTRAWESAEKLGIELNARHKMLTGKRKKLISSLTESKSAVAGARDAASMATSDISSVQREFGERESALVREESTLESICDRLKGTTREFSDAIEQKQKELAPWTAKISEHTAACEILQHERSWLTSHSEDTIQRVEDARVSLADLQRTMQMQTEEMESLQYEQRTLCDKMDEDRAQLAAMQDNERTLRQKRDQARRAAEDAKHSLASTKSRGEVLQSLVRQAELGLLSGFYGRLGSLGTIDPRYDVAISTACPGLNNLVVENVATGQQCIEYLRKHNLGRANFVLLQNVQVKTDAMGPITTPENVPRLFDLVTPKDARFAPAFYHQLGDTLVARDLAQANRIAYGVKRWRVVTEDGQLIDKSGTMSGGGSRVMRGAISSTLHADVSPEQASRMEKEFSAAESMLQSHIQSLAHLTTLIERNEARLPAIQKKLALLDMDVQTSTQRISEAEDHLHEAQAQSEPNQDDLRRIKELDHQLHLHQDEIATLKSKSADIEQAIHALQEQILEAGGVELRAQQAKVQGIKDMMSLCAERLAKSEEQHAKAENDLKRYEKALKSGQEQLDQLDAELQTLEDSRVAQASDLEGAAARIEHMREALEDRIEKRDQLQAQLDERDASLRAFRALMMELEQRLEDHEKTKSENEQRLQQWVKQHSQLVLIPVPRSEDDTSSSQLISDAHEEREHGGGNVAVKVEDGGGDNDDMEQEPINEKLSNNTNESQTCDEEGLADQLPTLTDDEARTVDKGRVQADMTRLEERLASSDVNLDVLEEFQHVEETFLARAKDLERVNEQRDQAQNKFEALRKERLERFMDGFTQISLKLKEMYQTITLGGNAELELVDSLDPFSEGIVFSVMPPKKTWKNISNLSGGEKTLSSLALVFALHAYKPTPLYVMDEIDAALDFRNVSIIANIIKERTRGAQFVVISLRNNMFELSSRLVGVYKTAHCTKSLTIENIDLHATSPLDSHAPPAFATAAAVPYRHPPGGAMTSPTKSGGRTTSSVALG